MHVLYKCMYVCMYAKYVCMCVMDNGYMYVMNVWGITLLA